MTTRREFLKYSALASAAALTPRFLQGLAPNRLAFEGNRLIVIQLSGGNDGLNTIVPYNDPQYHNLRRRIALAEREVIPLSDRQGLNPALSALEGIFKDGDITLLNAVGYPNPNRSHFRSMDIWHSGSSAEDYWQHGWLGRYLDHQCSGCAKPHLAIETDDSLSLALKGEQETGIAMRNPGALARNAEDSLLRTIAQHEETQHDELSYLYKTLTGTMNSAEYLLETYRRAPNVSGFPGTDLGRQLQLVTQLILAGAETSVYYVSLTGFDTHVRQKNAQERLLKQYGDAVATLREQLKRAGQWDNTLVLTFSEFGRRVADNAGGGTDHGKANNLWVMGGNLRHPGILNAPPDLNDLDDGDLKWQIDFRRVYANILGDWLGADARSILGGNFEALPLV